jgi:hypothetical protein
MKTPRIQWLTQDHSLWEADWLRFLFKEIQDFIEVEFNWTDIKTDSSTVLVCNHTVPYRNALEKLRQNGKKYAIFLLSDENLIEPCEWLHDPNCVGLIRNYINPNLIQHPKVTVVGLGCKIGLVKYLQDTQVDRDLMWSFAGTPHGERKNIVECLKVLEPSSVHSCSGFNAADGLNTEEYAKLLKRSKYVLCPPGQDSMDSFRLYEALEAGCVPICIKNTGYWHLHPTYWHGVFRGELDLPFVCEDTWEACVSKVQAIENENKYDEIKQECQDFWQRWKLNWQKNCTDVFNKL